ncbi:Manganese transport system ATP-binding protein MntB [Candidatus Promineifilum breve]|uniref:Manganese transport system ATP-binding protein MntB n=1 Tax=Candidatus Promineifilum breve TaxID=1806508 RepID=A0A160T3Q6_9CHLR|nr:metal ABC transporter ATP-binding protein [Candidatus Promineifilum breve]CUS04434.2 Manganese transport system ATP-binding protein MntB [Candidatus Promineifilum breve]
MKTNDHPPQPAPHGIAHEPDAPTLELADVWVNYNGTAPGSGPRHALEAISLRVERGERVAVVGPNGAGKSTLFKVIAGTLRPDRGRVDIFGHGPTGHICIAYVPQRNQVDWNFPVTVEDVVVMGRVGQIGLLRRPGKADWAVARAALGRVGAAALAHTRIGELSGGQQQRVFLARALAQEAELVLLDEPLNGLDIPTQEAILGILDDLRRDGVTVLLATHDLDLAAERFDRIMLLNRRVVAFEAPAAALRADNLLRAYGGHLHRVGEDGSIVLADTCCEGEGA